MDKTDFKKAMGHFASGVTVVTVADQHGHHGMTVSSFSSVSLDPPLVGFYIDNKATILQRLQAAEYLGISLLNAEQTAISNGFATKGQSWLPDVAVDLDAQGSPLIRDALYQLSCQKQSTVPAGDHTLFLCQVLKAVPTERAEAQPLVYYSGRYRDLVP